MDLLKRVVYDAAGGFVYPKGANKKMQTPAIHLWTGASISELEYTL